MSMALGDELAALHEEFEVLGAGLREEAEKQERETRREALKGKLAEVQADIRASLDDAAKRGNKKQAAGYYYYAQKPSLLVSVRGREDARAAVERDVGSSRSGGG